MPLFPRLKTHSRAYFLHRSRTHIFSPQLLQQKEPLNSNNIFMRYECCGAHPEKNKTTSLFLCLFSVFLGVLCVSSWRTSEVVRRRVWEPMNVNGSACWMGVITLYFHLYFTGGGRGIYILKVQFTRNTKNIQQRKHFKNIFSITLRDI